jgi:Zn-finger nucleic acid-binding protein
MRCPRDGSTLEETKFMEVIMDSCPLCYGAWLDEGELATLAKVQADILGGQKNLGKKDAPLVCPKCEISMEETFYSPSQKVLIDKCPRCSGIWLDTDELKKCLRIAYEQKNL